MDFGSVAVALALLYSLFTAFNIILNRYYLQDIFEKPSSLFFIGKITTVSLALPIGLIIGFDIPTEMTIILLIIVIGFIKSIPLYQFNKILQKSDASIVTPIIGFQPVLTVILAFIILGERLTIPEYVSVGLVLFGISYLMWLRITSNFYSFGELSGTLFYNKHILWAFILAFVWSFEAIIIKVLLSSESIITIYFWTTVAAFLFSALFLYKPGARKELNELTDQYQSKVIITYFVTETVTSIGWLAVVAALAFGPVMIVAPVLHSYGIFLFAFVIIFQMYGPKLDTQIGQKMTRKTIASIIGFTGIILLFII